MTDKELLEKRCIPAFDEMYSKAESAYPEKYGFVPTWDIMMNYCPRKDKTIIFPMDAFYLPHKEFTKIVDKHSKRLRSYWRFPYRTEYVYCDEEIERMKDELTECKEGTFEYDNIKRKIDGNEENRRRNALWDEYYKKLTVIMRDFEGKNISRKEYNLKCDALAKEYGCTKRSREREKISFFLALDSPTPSGNKEVMIKYRELYSKLEAVMADCTDFSTAVEKIENAGQKEKETLESMYYLFYNWKNDLKLV